MHALKQSDDPSNDHVKRLAATLLHNERLFIFSPAGCCIVWRRVFISQRLFAFLYVPFTRQWMFRLRVHA